MTVKPPNPPVGNDPPPRVRDLLGVAAPLFAVVSVLAYGIARVSYERFYDQFGIAPDDVGANSSRVLAESGAHLFVYSFLFAIVPYAFAFVVFRVLAPKAPKLGWKRLGFVAVSVVPLAVYQRLTGAGIFGGYVLVSLIGLAAIAVWTSRGNPSWWIVGLVWFSLGVFWVNLFYVPSAASRAGRCVVEHGQELRFVHTRRHFPTLGHPAVLGLRAQPAAVEWLGGSTSSPKVGRRLIYLGSSGGTVTLFDQSSDTTERLPESDVLVRVRAREPLCPELG